MIVAETELRRRRLRRLGPHPVDIELACVDCGRMRWVHPSEVQTRARCNSCAARERERRKRRARPPEEDS